MPLSRAPICRASLRHSRCEAILDHPYDIFGKGPAAWNPPASEIVARTFATVIATNIAAIILTEIDAIIVTGIAGSVAANLFGTAAVYCVEGGGQSVAGVGNAASGAERFGESTVLHPRDIRSVRRAGHRDADRRAAGEDGAAEPGGLEFCAAGNGDRIRSGSAARQSGSA